MGTAIKHLVPEWIKPAFVIFDITAPGTLTLNRECQSVWMSKITNDGLTLCGTGCFIAGISGRQMVKLVGFVLVVILLILNTVACTNIFRRIYLCDKVCFHW